MATWNRTEPANDSAKPATSALLTLAHEPTFTITELLGTSDSLAWKKHMVGLGFKDATPLYGHKKGVVTFNNLTSKDWERYQKAFSESATAMTADWHYFSGHHSSHLTWEFLASSPSKVKEIHDNCGFFNEAYHHSTWNGYKPKPNSIYVRVSRSSVGSISDPSDNPFIWPMTPSARGIIANGCNTFTFRHTRLWLRKMFPTAVIIGYVGKTPSGPEAIFPLIGGGGLKGLYQGDASFWKDPIKRFLAADGSVDDTRVFDDLVNLNVLYATVTKRRYGAARSNLSLMIGTDVYVFFPSENKDLTELARVKSGSVQKERFDLG